MPLASNDLPLQTPSKLGEILFIPGGPAPVEPPPCCLPGLLQAASATSSLILQCLFAHSQNRMFQNGTRFSSTQQSRNSIRCMFIFPGPSMEEERGEKLQREDPYLRERSTNGSKTLMMILERARTISQGLDSYFPRWFNTFFFVSLRRQHAYIITD